MDKYGKCLNQQRFVALWLADSNQHSGSTKVQTSGVVAAWPNDISNHKEPGAAIHGYSLIGAAADARFLDCAAY
jgi:hypothetical protein